MKAIYLILLFIPCICYSQSSENDLANLYEVSIEKFIDKRGLKLSDIYFIQRNISENLLPKEIKGNQIQYFDIYDKHNRGTLKKGINAISLDPIVLKGNIIEIPMIDFKINYRRKNYSFQNQGGIKVIFEYSCLSNTWEYKDVEEGNI